MFNFEEFKALVSSATGVPVSSLGLTCAVTIAQGRAHISPDESRKKTFERMVQKYSVFNFNELQQEDKVITIDEVKAIVSVALGVPVEQLSGNTVAEIISSGKEIATPEASTRESFERWVKQTSDIAADEPEQENQSGTKDAHKQFAEWFKEASGYLG